MIAEILTAAALVSGAAFAALAGLGVVRFPDIYIRMHAATKAGTLGAGLVLLAVAIHFGTAGVTVRVVAAVTFLLVTAPVAAHMIGRAAYRSGVPMWKKSIVDEWGLQQAPEPQSRENIDLLPTHPSAAASRTQPPDPTGKKSPT